MQLIIFASQISIQPQVSAPLLFTAVEDCASNIIRLSSFENRTAISSCDISI